MEFSADGNLLARILLTLAALGYGVVTIKADFNATHATNPRWTPHARFHVVWQITSYAGVMLIALGLIWLKGPHPTGRLYLAAALGFAIYGRSSRPCWRGRSSPAGSMTTTATDRSARRSARRTGASTPM